MWGLWGTDGTAWFETATFTTGAAQKSPAATIGPSPHGRSRTAQRERSCLRQLMSLGSEMGVWDAMGCYGMLWDAMGCYGMGVLVAIVLHRKGLMDGWLFGEGWQHVNICKPHVDVG